MYDERVSPRGNFEQEVSGALSPSEQFWGPGVELNYSGYIVF